MFKLPKSDQRLAVVGHTGSGKTVFAGWALSHANLSGMPWLIIDYKRDGFLNSIEKTHELKVTGRIPKKAGLYLVHPLPDQDDAVEDLMWRIWEKGNTGLYVDEAHMLPNKGGFRALLTQGRSLKIPMITLTQRPSWVSRFAFSEADFISAFHLTYPDDRRFIAGMLDSDLAPLPQYHSRYHQIADHSTYKLRPVPGTNLIRERIEAKLLPNTLWA